ncbi:MAG: aldose epimerase family protein [Pseudomonadota bacterium]
MALRALAACLLCASASAGAAIQAQDWGHTRAGQAVGRVTLENLRGMRVSYIDYGATLTAIEVADRHGQRRNVVLSLPTLADYEATGRRYGAIMGRYAGRIGNARFMQDGRPVELVPNAKGTALHGDPDGFDRRVWQRRDFADADSLGSVYRLTSPDGDQHFPGRVEISVTYRLLRKHNEFRIEYAASSDAPTVINLTNHAYFNLAGAGSGGLATHRFTIHAARFAETDAKRVPTGVLLPVAGTPLDLRRAAAVMPRLRASALLGDPPGFDHSLLFSKKDGALALVAEIVETGSGRRLRVASTEPSVQFNSGNGFDGSEIGSEGVGYRRHDGFAFETQHLPDSPNHPNFPTTRLAPGQQFRSTTSYRFD